MTGPYETETQALAEPLRQEIRALHASSAGLIGRANPTENSDD